TRRFATAEEMAEQLTGVLREVVALQSGRPHPAVSTLFGPELRVTDTEVVPDDGVVSRLGERPAPVARALRRARTAPELTAGTPPAHGAPDPAAAALALPMPRVDPGDPNAGFLAGLAAAAPPS
ncbi:serine/threonine protein kinase, partial [Streptomyces sp. NRRL F-6602]